MPTHSSLLVGPGPMPIPRRVAGHRRAPPPGAPSPARLRGTGAPPVYSRARLRPPSRGLACWPLSRRRLATQRTQECQGSTQLHMSGNHPTSRIKARDFREAPNFTCQGSTQLNAAKPGMSGKHHQLHMQIGCHVDMQLKKEGPLSAKRSCATLGRL
eukprot:363857-Chlamydomonas_euryale.AAC.13